MKETLKIGITGGIGSGKSVISHLFKVMGYPTYDSDAHAKMIMHNHPKVKKQLIDLLGEKVYQTDQSLDRAYLAKKLFTNKTLLEAVNKIVHPVVFEEFNAWAQRSNSELICIESAILFETDLPRFLDQTITVTAPLELRYKRILKRDKSTKEEIKQRIKNQLDESTRCKKADFIILNDEQHSLIQQSQKIIDKLLQTT